MNPRGHMKDLLAGLAFIWAHGALAAADIPDPLIFGSDHDYPPYEYIENGKPTGFNVDLVRALGAALGVQVEVRLGPWHEIRQALEKEHTVHVSDMFYSEARASAVEFADPFSIVYFELFVRRNDPLPCAFDVLQGRRVLVQKASFTHENLLQHAPGAILVPVESEPQALRLLAGGHADCALVTQASARVALKRFRIAGVVSTGKPVFPRDYSLVVAKGNHALVGHLNRALKQIKADGTYADLHEKWFGELRPPGPWRDFVNTQLPFVAGIVLLLTFAALLWSATLRRQVARRTLELSAELKERQRAEERRHESEQQLVMALQAANMGTWTRDLHTYEMKWSEEAASILGRTPDALPQDYPSYLELIHAEDRARIARQVENALRSGTGYVAEYRIVWPSGSSHWVSDRGKVMPVANGSASRMAGTLVDISQRMAAAAERERLVNELTARNAEMENFVYTISHDLKSPVITIDGFARYLELDIARADLDAAREGVREIRHAAQQMQRLIEDLLILSRSGRIIGDPVPVALDELVAQILHQNRDRYKRRKVTVRRIGELPTATVDAPRIAQVFQVLLDNAVQYRREGVDPYVEIGQQRLNGELRIYVRDNGRGIPPVYHERIFELFQRLDHDTGGTGVGLTIARRIVEQHGGRLWVESDTGVGATFWLGLPLSLIVE